MHQVSGYGQAKNRPAPPPTPPSSIDGLWILLVANEGELPVTDPEGRVPMMARAGDDQHYLLAFKNVAKARQFLAACEVTADPRMVVRGNKADLLKIAESAKVAGVLVDYDPATQGYAFAIELS
jgi:hypothetical protein